MKETYIIRAIQKFDEFREYLDKKIERDIEEYRKGQFVLRIVDENGKPVPNADVKVRQTSHDFKFGCNIFHLDQFPDEKRRAQYRDLFKNLFNYAVVPFYWDTLEPVEGQPRFEKNAPMISRRPAIDTIMEFCEENRIETKGHCLAYNSFQPDWLPERNREIKIKLENRVRAIAQRYGDRIPDLDVINEMLTIYKNCYKGNGMRNLQITDERDHEKWCFELCRRYFPHARLFWNEGMHESFGEHYRGHRSFYYMTLEKMLSMGVPVEGIGMQYHAFTRGIPELETQYNPLRMLDVLECYGEFGLPIHLSEVSIPSFGNEPEDEQLQAELTKRLYKLWFSQKQCEAIVWWNMADGTAYGGENTYYAGLVRNDCTKKPAYEVLEQLINEQWRTEFRQTVNGELRFAGFYGTYELEITSGGKTVVKQIGLHKDNTGFDNRLCDFRSKEITV